MRKIAFYPKLAASNLWRNRSVYLPFMLAGGAAVASLYCLFAMVLSGVLMEMPRGAEYIQMLAWVGIVVLSIISLIIMLWTNGFLTKRRKKELGLYSVLGMEKRNMGILMLCETVYTALLALLPGIITGMLLSQLVFLLMLRLTTFPVEFSLPVSGAAVFATAVVFGVIFLLLLLFNLRQVGKAKPVELMRGAQEGEKEPKASWLLTLIGILFVGGGYVFAVTVRDPAFAILFFLVAALFVIIGTYCLFISGSVLWFKLLRKRKSYYYQPRHFVTVSGLIYRMKQNAAGLAGICVLSCMVMVTLSSTVTLYSSSQVDYNYPREYRLVYQPIEGGFHTEPLLADAHRFADDYGVSIVNTVEYTRFTEDIFFLEEEGGWAAVDNETYSRLVMEGETPHATLSLVFLEDFNSMEGTNYTLEEGEALLFYTGMETPPTTMHLNGENIPIKGLPESWRGQKNADESIGETFTLIMTPASAHHVARQVLGRTVFGFAEGDTTAYAENLGFQYEYCFDLEGEYADQNAFLDVFRPYCWNLYMDEQYSSAFVNVSSQWESQGEWFVLYGGLLFLGIFLGVLFAGATVMIIYYKQISEGTADRERFIILQQVGMSEDEVKKTIHSQIRTVFFLPLVVAIIHMGFAFFAISRGLVIFNFTDVRAQLIGTGVTILLYAACYLLVYLRTAKTYYRLVRYEAAA